MVMRLGSDVAWDHCPEIIQVIGRDHCPVVYPKEAAELHKHAATGRSRWLAESQVRKAAKRWPQTLPTATHCCRRFTALGVISFSSSVGFTLSYLLWRLRRRLFNFCIDIALYSAGASTTSSYENDSPTLSLGHGLPSTST